MLASLGAGLLFGLAPALSASAVESRHALRATNRITERRSTLALRNALLVGQFGLSLVLLAGAALMIESVWRQQRVPLGFSPENLLVFNASFPRSAPYVTDAGVRPDDARNAGTEIHHWALTPHTLTLPSRVVERLRAAPGVRNATAASGLPFLRSFGVWFSIAGRPAPTPEKLQRMVAIQTWVTPGYIDTLGLRVVRGRDFTVADGIGAPRVLIVSEYLARTHFGDEASALGQRLVFQDSPEPFQIVGIVSDVRFWLGERVPAQVYAPMSQNVQAYAPFTQTLQSAYTDTEARWRLDFWFAVRTGTESAIEKEAIRRAFEEAEHGAPAENLVFMRDVLVSGEFAKSRALTWLLCASAGLAVLLAAIGVFGVVSYSVAQRTHEFGVRVALGATYRQVVGNVIAFGVRLALVGVVLGALAAYWLVRFIARELYEVDPANPVVFLSVALVLTAIVALACWLPARKAATVDPLIALRCE